MCKLRYEVTMTTSTKHLQSVWWHDIMSTQWFCVSFGVLLLEFITIAS